MNKEQIAAEIAACESRLKELREKLVEWKRPRVGDGCGYYVVRGAVVTSLQDYRDGYDNDVYNFGNYWLSKESAEHFKLRIESMNPVMPEPEKGDSVFHVYIGPGRSWTSTNIDYRESYTAMYLAGRIHPTKESAREWIEKYGEAWTTVPQEFK